MTFSLGVSLFLELECFAEGIAMSIVQYGSYGCMHLSLHRVRQFHVWPDLYSMSGDGGFAAALVAGVFAYPCRVNL